MLQDGSWTTQNRRCPRRQPVFCPTNARVGLCLRIGNLSLLALSTMPAGEPDPTATSSEATTTVREPFGGTSDKAMSSVANSSKSHSDGEAISSSANENETKWTPDVPESQDSAQPQDHSSPEIQELLDQFAVSSSFSPNPSSHRSPGRVTFAGTPMSLPERKSSLDPFRMATIQRTLEGTSDPESTSDNTETPLVAKPEDFLQGDTLSRVASQSSEKSASKREAPLQSVPSVSHPKPLPLSEPEPDVPFDFHRFLEQLRHRTADPVAKFLRSFLTEFGKKQWMAHEQVKIVGDFLSFIAGKMAQCEVWRDFSDIEFENAKEGMEKLVMNRLYSQTFSPAIPPAGTSALQKGDKHVERRSGTGRRGQHQEDVERDDILAQKIQIYRWIGEPHLDIPPVDDQGKRFLNLAQQGVWFDSRVEFGLTPEKSCSSFRHTAHRAIKLSVF